MGLLSGLANLGLDNFEKADIFAADDEKSGKGAKEAQEAKKPDEKDLVYDKKAECPVCYESFMNKTPRIGKTKVMENDWDLRPRQEGFDPVKYDVILCPYCGYAAMTRFFPHVTSNQAKLIREQVSARVKLPSYTGEIYTYDEAMERYKIAMVNAVVKKAKTSEKAFICLKSAWICRGYAEFLAPQASEYAEKIAQLKAEEEENLKDAFQGFKAAVQSEGFPMCGMDETTVNYLMAELAFHFKEMDLASRLVSAILVSPTANRRTKDKARDLKDAILAERKNSR